VTERGLTFRLPQDNSAYSLLDMQLHIGDPFAATDQEGDALGNVCADHFVMSSDLVSCAEDVKRGVLIRDGKFVTVNSADPCSESFLFEYSEGDSIVPRLLSVFSPFMGSGIVEDERLSEAMSNLQRELGDHLSGSKVGFESLNELLLIGQSATSSIADTRKKLERAESSLSSLRFEGVALSVSSSKFNRYTPSAPSSRLMRVYGLMGERRSEIKDLEARLDSQLAMREGLGLLLADVVVGTRATGDSEVDAVAFGTAGAMLEQMDLKDLSRSHYETASRIGDEAGNPLSARYFELQAIRMMPEEDDAWEAKVVRIDELSANLSGLNGMLMGREMFYEARPIYIRGIKATEAIVREIGAQALMEKVGIHRRNELDADSDIFEELHGQVMDCIGYVTSNPASQAEAGYLSLALTGLEEARVELAATQSKMGDLEELEDLLPLIRKDAEAAYAMMDSFDQLEDPLAEAYAQLLKVSYFLPEQQCGLPLDAIESWMKDVDAKFPNAEPVVQFTNYLREKAPHLFYENGALKPRGEMPDAPDALAAIDAEGTLHILAGTMGEGVAIGGTASLAGAYGLGKAGLLCGPFAEICVPAGAAIGGACGFLFGEGILHWIHSDEIDSMESQVGKAGLALARITPEEASMQRWIGYGCLSAGIIFSGAAGRGGAGLFGKMLSGARSLGRKQTYVNFGRWMGHQGGEMIHELRYFKNVIRATGHGLYGAFTKRAPKDGMAVVRSVDDLFDETFVRLSPGQRALLGESEDAQRAAWREIAESLATHGESHALTPPLAKALPSEMRGLLDRWLWKPVNSFMDNQLGLAKLDKLWVGRVDAAHMAIRGGVPEVVQDRAVMMFRKELLTHQGRIARGWTAGMKAQSSGLARGIEAFSARLGPYTKPLWSNQIFTPQFARAHRLGVIPLAADFFYDGDGDDVLGGGWTLHDGDIDTWWGFGGLVASTGYYSTRLGINSIYGADIAGTAKALTFASFLGIAGQQALDVDFNRLSWSQIEYLAILPTTLMLYSGIHASGSSRLMMASTALPFARRIPSLSSPMYRSAFKLTSSLTKPAMQGAWGRGLSLGYTIPWIMGMTYMFSGEGMLDADPYFVGQRGLKFAAVGLLLNPLMVQLGGKSAIGQGASRILGYGFDLIPAIPMSPYYNKGVFDKSLGRALSSTDAGEQDLAMDIFMSRVPIWGSADLGRSISTINRTYDVGGFMSATNKDKSFEMLDSDTWLNPDSHFDISDPSTYSFGWRWEPQALIKWLDVLDELADKKVDGGLSTISTEEVHKRFIGTTLRELSSPAKWKGDAHYKRGIIILGMMMKLRINEGGSIAGFYGDSIKKSGNGVAEFMRGVPNPYDRDEFRGMIDDVQAMGSSEIDALLAPLLK
jgi:hypothetical protein